jgi:putative CocE/NonD family hydrolase
MQAKRRSPLPAFPLLAAITGMALAAVSNSACAQAAQPAASASNSASVRVQWGVKIPLRDGVELNATVYRNKASQPPSPCIFTLTPYISNTYHERGTYFAAHGLPFLIVDVRGRGNSGGTFRPFIQEINDGYDVVEWLAKQPYCNGKVSMWGGSYAGYNQWATAKNRPPHLATIVPAAAAHAGVDFPWRNNIGTQYVVQWLTLVAGHTSQMILFSDQPFWSGLWRDRFVSGEPYSNLEYALGVPQPQLREWIAHPEQDEYFDAFVPSPDDYRAMNMPILTITGSYDDDQPGALTYYANAMRYGSAAQSARHYLVIGPWDHAGTRTPRDSVGGVKFGPRSLLDLPALHADWYRWTMADGPKPDFLKKRVAWYVMGSDTWRYADTLEAVTARSVPYFLSSKANADKLAAPGSLSPKAPAHAWRDEYIYDPRDVANAELESKVDADDPTNTQMLAANDGKQLVYDTDRFERDTEISGFFKLSAWIGIDQPDTDFQALVYEVAADGKSILLTTDILRARYRENFRSATLVATRDPLLYTFEHFTFTSRLVAKGSRLRLVIGPINSIFTQKNYDSGKAVSEETMADARTVKAELFHDLQHASALYIPFGAGAK